MDSKEEVLQIPPIGSYSPGAGYFGILNGNSIHWESCRDRFYTASEPANFNGFLFYNPHKGDVKAFIEMVEDIIQLPEEDKLVIKKTTHKYVLWIELSKWWKYRIRRSLLTAFLRCGMNYTEKNGPGFNKALNSISYVSGTRYAIDRFLSGRTASKLKKTTTFSGWYAYFYGKNEKAVDAVLVKPKKINKEENK